MDEIHLTREVIADWANSSVLDGPVALHFKQRLRAVDGGEHQIVFPPTYADIGYNIDALTDGTKVVTIDSVGSQANRMEPIFKEEPYASLVPKIEIEIPARKENKSEHNQTLVNRLSLLDLAHRVADATVFACPTLGPGIRNALSVLNSANDAGPLCRIAPTSFLFGFWDSRGGVGEKRPRIIRSIIRAWDVEVLHAAAQFTSVRKLLDEDTLQALQKSAKEKKKDLSEIGLDDAPAVFRRLSGNAARETREYANGAPNPERRVLGGVFVHGTIERDITLNLIALRRLGGINQQETDALLQYLLCLSLIAASPKSDLFLREGCHLVPAEAGQWKAIFRDGVSRSVNIGSDNTEKAFISFAESAFNTFKREFKESSREQFGEDWIQSIEGQPHKFDLNTAKKLIATTEIEDGDGGE